MKKIDLTLFVLLICTMFSANTMAQDSKIMAGAGLNFSTNISNMGLSAKGVYLINDKWEAAAAFNYYFKSDYTNWTGIDLDAHHNFYAKDKLSVYALGGLNFTFWKVKYAYDYGFWGLGSSLEDNTTTGTEVGVNIGAGGRFAINNKIHLLGEARYTVGGFGFFTIGAGVLYHF